MEVRKISNLIEAQQLDGVYVFEVDPPGYVGSVGTGIVGMVGLFEMGPVDEVVSIGSPAEARRIFGGYGVATAGQESSFRGYSGHIALTGKYWPGLRVVRAGNGTMAKADATIDLVTHDTDPVVQGRALTVTAKWKGRYGNRIIVTIDEASNSSLTNGFRLNIRLDDRSESIDNLHAAMTVLELAEISKGLQLVDLAIANANDAAQEEWPLTVTLADGSDGAAALQNWTDGIDKILARREVSIIFAAEPDGATVTFAALNAYIKGKVAPATGTRPFVHAVLSGPAGDTIDEAATAASGLRSDQLIYTYPWRKQVFAGASPAHPGGILTVPSNSVVASALANIDVIYDPASREGTRYIDAATVGLEFDDLDRDDYVTAKEQGVCALEFDPDIGHRVVSGITTSLVPGREQIHVSRTADFLNASIARFLKFYQNQPMTDDWKDQVNGAIAAFLEQQKRPLGPVPNRLVDYVVDTVTVNDSTTEAAGIYNILIKCRTVASARYIVLLSQIGTNVEVRREPDQFAA
ncbi:MAG TPA: hypothetical protein VK181_20495 [Rhizobium sp.]|nr:hypothetical protein [Rhizobium sp.]